MTNRKNVELVSNDVKDSMYCYLYVQQTIATIINNIDQMVTVVKYGNYQQHLNPQLLLQLSILNKARKQFNKTSIHNTSGRCK